MSIRSVVIITTIDQTAKFGGDYDTVYCGLSSSQPQTSWLLALRRLGVVVRVIGVPPSDDSLISRAAAPYRKYKRTKRLESDLRALHAADAFDLVIVGTNLESIIGSDLVSCVRGFGSKIVVIDGLSPKWTKNLDILEVSRRADLTFVNSIQNANEYYDLGVSSVACVPVSAYDNRLNRSKPAAPYQHQVISVGSVDGRLYSRRSHFLRYLSDFEFGYWAPSPSKSLDSCYESCVYEGTVSRIDIGSAYETSPIVVNIHGIHMADGGNLSTYEIAGVGTSLQLVDNVRACDYRDGEHLVVIRNEYDLRDKVRYFLKNDGEAEQIRENGMKHTLENHTFDKRFEYMFWMLRHL